LKSKIKREPKITDKEWQSNLYPLTQAMWAFSKNILQENPAGKGFPLLNELNLQRKRQ
jgi:hypothetical protein